MALVSYENSDSESEINLETKTNKEEVPIEVKKRIKIDIPHLSHFDIKEDEPSKKIIKTNSINNSSGLFKILPSPIHKPLDKIYKFNAAVVKEKNLVPRIVKTGKQNLITGDTEEEEIYNKNYFFADTTSKNKKKHATNIPVSFNNIEINSAPVKKEISVKTNAYFSRLVSKTSDKNKVTKLEECEPNLIGDSNIIDINSAEFKNDWKMNTLKEETSSVFSKSEKKEEEPSTVSKRKHQITYLAYQAKKNEEQMKEQWAMNKMTRKQTQARYGF